MIRKPIVDLLRTIAIMLMIFFHLCYDLTLFGHLSIDFFYNPFWFYLPRLIVSLFLISSAASLVFSYQSHFNWPKFFRRFGKIAFCALMVSVVTYFLFPNNWVLFGTLHCIALTSVIAIPFLKSPRLSLILAILSLLLVIVLKIDTQFFSSFFPFKSMDFIPPFPWMGMVWLGIFLSHSPLLNAGFNHPKLNKITYFLSKHSLKIYLVHQPLFFGLIWLISLRK